MLVVSPLSAASSSQIGWLSFARSICALVDPASRTIAKPSRYLPRSDSCSTKPRDSSTAISRDTVDLCTPNSVAISVTPAVPSLPRISSTSSARSTDCTGATDFSLGGVSSLGRSVMAPIQCRQCWSSCRRSLHCAHPLPGRHRGDVADPPLHGRHLPHPVVEQAATQRRQLGHRDDVARPHAGRRSVRPDAPCAAAATGRRPHAGSSRRPRTEDRCRRPPPAATASTPTPPRPSAHPTGPG